MSRRGEVDAVAGWVVCEVAPQRAFWVVWVAWEARMVVTPRCSDMLGVEVEPGYVNHGFD
jgi:hypothetical protein